MTMTMTTADQAYREGAAQGSTPVGRVVMLYDQLVRDLSRATSAHAAADIARRSDELSHAHTVLGMLQGTLNLERGGEVARNLDRMYDILRGQLLDAQFKASAEILEAPLRVVLLLREAWVEADAKLSRAAPVAEGRSSGSESNSYNPADNTTNNRIPSGSGWQA